MFHGGYYESGKMASHTSTRGHKCGICFNNLNLLSELCIIINFHHCLYIYDDTFNNDKRHSLFVVRSRNRCFLLGLVQCNN